MVAVFAGFLPKPLGRERPMRVTQGQTSFWRPLFLKLGTIDGSVPKPTLKVQFVEKPDVEMVALHALRFLAPECLEDTSCRHKHMIPPER